MRSPPPLSSPPFFYEFHLAAGRINARASAFRLSGLFIGWNRRIAWGASAGADSHVVFLDCLA
jgi:acyl-homoserine lactone acylase PvdQ